MLAQRIIGYFTTNQRIAHFLGAVANTIRGRNGEFRLHQPHGQLAIFRTNTRQQGIMDRLYFRANPDIAL